MATQVATQQRKRKTKAVEAEVTYEIGGCWGCAIYWNSPEQFSDMRKPYEFHCHGWQERRPKVGDVLKGDFKKSIMWFEFVSVEYMTDPRDMFSARVRLFKQESK